MEAWLKDTCPKCRKANWIHQYVNLSDCSGTDVDGIECWSCKHKWVIYPELGEGEQFDKGRKRPT